MATKRKLENPDDAELDAVRAKIRELEGTLQSLKDKELQLLKNDQVHNKDQEVIDFLSVHRQSRFQADCSQDFYILRLQFFCQLSQCLQILEKLHRQ